MNTHASNSLKTGLVFGIVMVFLILIGFSGTAATLIGKVINLNALASGAMTGAMLNLMIFMAIMGILGGIAIPAYLGQRRRARVIGDAQSQARILAMALETRRADNGTYGTSMTTVTYTAAGARPTASADLAPSFRCSNGNTQMNYSVAVGTKGLLYTITVNDPRAGSAPVLTLDQNGTLKLDATYNK